jgi:hypothetical protein
MNSVQFGGRNSQLAVLAQQIAALQVQQRAAEGKAVLETLKSADPNELLDVAQAAVTAQLGDKAEFVKTIALGSEEAAGEAMMNTHTEGVERAGNVVTAIDENFGPQAGAVASGLAQQGLGLVTTGLGLLRQGAQLAPVVLPAVADQAQKSFKKNAQGQEKAAGILEQAAAKVNANAAEVKVVGGKVSEFLTALGARIGAAQAPEQGE